MIELRYTRPGSEPTSFYFADRSYEAAKQALAYDTRMYPDTLIEMNFISDYESGYMFGYLKDKRR